MFTCFMLMNATREWLVLTPEEREDVVATRIQPILAEYPAVQITFYDVEAFSARCSDIAIFESTSIDDYRAVIDGLRSSPIYTVPYFEIVDILPATKADFV